MSEGRLKKQKIEVHKPEQTIVQMQTTTKEHSLGRCWKISADLKAIRCKKEAGKNLFCSLHRNWLFQILIFIASALSIAFLGDYLWEAYGPLTSKDQKSQDAQNKTLQIVDETNNKVANIEKMLLEQNRSHDKKNPALNAFTQSESLEEKYGLGYALFFSDGRKNLHYGVMNNDQIKFDPADVKITYFGGSKVCFSMILNGNYFSDNCFSGTQGGSLIQISDYARLVVEPIVSSGTGVVWVIGIKKITN